MKKMTKLHKWNIYDKIRFNRVLLKYINEDGIKKHANDILHDMNDKSTFNEILFINKVLDLNNCETVEYTKENIIEYLRELFDNNDKNVLTLEDFNYRTDAKEQGKDQAIQTNLTTDKLHDKKQILETLVSNMPKRNEFDSNKKKNTVDVANDSFSSSRAPNTTVTNVGYNNDNVSRINDIGDALRSPSTVTSDSEKNNFIANSISNRINTKKENTSVNTSDKNINLNPNLSDNITTPTKAIKSQIKSTKNKSRPGTKANIGGSKSFKDNCQYNQNITNRFGRNTRIVIEKGDEDDNNSTETDIRNLKNISDNSNSILESLNATLNAQNGEVTKEEKETKMTHRQLSPSIVSSPKPVPTTVKSTADIEAGIHNSTNTTEDRAQTSSKQIKESNDNNITATGINNGELNKDNSIKKHKFNKEKNERAYVAKEHKKEEIEEKEEVREQNKIKREVQEVTKFQKGIPNKEENDNGLMEQIDTDVGEKLNQHSKTPINSQIETIPDASKKMINVADRNSTEQEGTIKKTNEVLEDKNITNVAHVNRNIDEENVVAKSGEDEHAEERLELFKTNDTGTNNNVELYEKNEAKKVVEPKKDTISTSGSYPTAESMNKNENIANNPSTVVQQESVEEVELVNEEDEDNESKLSQVDDEVDVEKDEHVKVQVGILKSFDENESELDTKSATQSDDINHVLENKQEDGKDKHKVLVGNNDNWIDKETSTKMVDTENENKTQKASEMEAGKGELKEKDKLHIIKDKDQDTCNYSDKDSSNIKMIQKQQDKANAIKPKKKGNKGKKKLIDTKEEEPKQTEFKNANENPVTIEKSNVIEDAPIESRTRSKLKIKEDIESIVYQRDGQQENILSARNRRKLTTKLQSGEGENKKTSSGKTIVVAKEKLIDDVNIKKQETTQKQENNKDNLGKGKKLIKTNEEEKVTKKNTSDNYNSDSLKNENIPKAVTRKSARIRKRIREGSDNTGEERASKQIKIINDNDDSSNNTNNDNRVNTEGDANKEDSNQATNSKKSKEVTNIVKKSRSLRKNKTKVNSLLSNNKLIADSSDNTTNKKNEKNEKTDNNVAKEDSLKIKNNNEFLAAKNNVTLNNTNVTMDTEPIGRRLRKRK